MRKSPEFALAPKPLSGIARYSPGRRPSMIEEKPWTGWDGSGNVIPFCTPGGSSVPAGGPGASVAAGRTARPARVTRSIGSAEAGRIVVNSPAVTAEVTAIMVSVLDLFMLVLLSFWRSSQRVDLPGSRPRRASVPNHARDRFVPTSPCARDTRRGGCCP